MTSGWRLLRAHPIIDTCGPKHRRDDAPKSAASATRAPAFFWMAVGMLALLFLCGVVAVGLLAYQAERITRDGGMGWLLFGAVFVAVASLVFSAVGLCAAVSLWRREPHRTWSIVLLVGSCFFVWAF